MIKKNFAIFLEFGNRKWELVVLKVLKEINLPAVGRSVKSFERLFFYRF
jgi:hypothetical protein